MQTFGRSETFTIDYRYYTHCGYFIKYNRPTYKIKKEERALPLTYRFIADPDYNENGPNPNILQWIMGLTVCANGQIKTMKVDRENEDCGIGGMLSYLCMTDEDVMNDDDDDETHDVKGFQLPDELSNVQGILHPKRCTRLFFTDFQHTCNTCEHQDIPGIVWCPAGVNTLRGILQAALDAKYRWTIVIDKMDPTVNDLTIHATDDVMQPDVFSTITQNLQRKFLFCQQYSVKWSIHAMTEKFLSVSINKVRYNLCPKKTKDRKYFVKKIEEDDNHRTFWASFDKADLERFTDPKDLIHVSIAHIECKGGRTTLTSFDKPGQIKDYKGCGIMDTLQYLCYTDADVIGQGKGYDINTDYRLNEVGRTDAKKWKDLLETSCTKIYFGATMFGTRETSPLTDQRVIDLLSIYVDSGYEDMVIISSAKEDVNTKAKQNKYSTEEILISMMKHPVSKNRFLDMVAYFCKK